MMDAVTPDASATTGAGDALTPKPKALPRKHFFDDMPDRGLFGLTAVFGFVLIVVAKLYDLIGSDVLAGVAVAIMVAYGAFAYRIQAVQLRLDRLGDNFYYLGFIFTLASMSVALIQLRGGANVDALLGSFGIALFTTIVGVAGRVLFVQMRTEIDDLETAARRDLLSATNDLRSQLALSLREFETFQCAVRQAAADTLSRVEGDLAGGVAAVDGGARLLADRVHAAFQANLGHAKALTANIEELATAVDALSARLNTVDLPTEALDARLASFGKELEQVLARVNAVVAEMEKHRRPGRRFWRFRRT